MNPFLANIFVELLGGWISEGSNFLFSQLTKESIEWQIWKQRYKLTDDDNDFLIRFVEAMNEVFDTKEKRQTFFPFFKDKYTLLLFHERWYAFISVEEFQFKINQQLRHFSIVEHGAAEILRFQQKFEEKVHKNRTAAEAETHHLVREIHEVVQRKKDSINSSEATITSNLNLLGQSPISYFVGREDLLNEIETGFAAGMRVQILHGMMGIGKRRVVYEYTKQRLQASNFRELIWCFDASDGGNDLENQFNNLAKGLKINVSNFLGQSLKDQLLGWLERTPNWLLIFANAPHPSVLQGFIPLGIGHVLITSENPAWAGYFPASQILEVKPLDKANSIQLLKIRSGNKMNLENMAVIAENLGGYPFFLEQFGALYGENITQNEDTSSLIEILSPGSGEEMTKRQQQFLDLLFAIAGVQMADGKLDKGALEVFALFHAKAPQPIPKDFIMGYGAHGLDDLNFQGRWYAFLMKPFIRWATSRRKKINQQKEAFLERLARHSLIQIGSDKLIYMHRLVHDFFADNAHLQLANDFRGKFLVAGPMIDFTLNRFKFSTKNKIEIEYRRHLLPHVISIADYLKMHFGHVHDLDRLYNRVGDFYEDEQRFEPALYYFSQALKLQKTRKEGPSTNLISEYYRMAAFSGQITAYDELQKDFPISKYLKEYECLLCEAVKHYWLFKHDEAVNLLEHAIEVVPSNLDVEAKRVMEMLVNLIIAPPVSEESESLLNEQGATIIEKSGEISFEYVAFLTMKAELRTRQAERAIDSQTLMFEEASLLLDHACEILRSLGQKSTYVYWTCQFLQIDCQRILENEERVKDILLLLEQNQVEIKATLGQNHYIFCAQKLAIAYLCKIRGDKTACLSAIEEAIEIVRKAFPSYPDHPKMRMIEAILEDEKSSD
ncbi:MAG: hypothetical protein IT258_13700 [Saprospiraceae bacterium]|nr:hypothetical protein [Saprospiraceae bacterium]